MSSFRGIDPAALGALAVQLDWAAAALGSESSTAYTRLTRHSRWAAADTVGSSLSRTANWATLSATDMRNRIEMMASAQSVCWATGSGPGGPWQPGGPAVPFPWTDLPGPPPYATAGTSFDGWATAEEWMRGALGVWNGRVDDTFPLGRWTFGLLWANRVRSFSLGRAPIVNGVLHVPSVANGLPARTLSRMQYFRWINNPAVQTVGRRASVVLSFASVFGDTKVMIDHGNPIDAFQEDGAGYVADAARLGFSVSTTAFLIAPYNPVFAGAVVVTGLVWAGAEIVDHWDDITEFWGDVYGDIGDGVGWLADTGTAAIGAGWDWTAQQWDTTTAWVGDQFANAYSWGGDRVEDITEVAQDQLERVRDGVEWTADRLDDAGDWASDRVDDLTDVGEGIVDTGGDLVDGAVGLGKKIFGF